MTADSGAEIAPGVSPGVLNTGAVTLKGNSTFTVEINGTTLSNFDQLNVTGTVTIDSAELNVSLGGSYAPSPGDSIVIINNDGTDSVTGTPGTFDGLPEGGLLAVAGTIFAITYAGGTDANDVVLTVISNPTGNNDSVNTLEDTSHTFAASDFTFNDADSHTFSGIQIVTVETNGDLEYDGTDVAASINAPDVTKLVFAPDPDDSPANNFAQVKITTLPEVGSLKLDGTAVTAGVFVTLVW